MKKTEVNHLLECIEKICETAHSTKLTETTQKSISIYTKDLAQYLGSTERQAFWFSILFSISLHRPEIDLEDIASYLKCSILAVFKYIDDFDELVKLKVLRKSKADRRRRKCPDRLDTLQFYVPTYIIQSISSGDKQLTTRQKSSLTVYEVLDVYGNLLQERYNQLLSQDEFDEEAIALLQESKHLPFVKIIQGFKLCPSDLFLLLYMCAEFTDYEEADLITFSKTYFTDSTHQMVLRKEFIKGTNRLQVLKLVDTPSDNFRSDRTIVLSEYAKDLLFGEDKDLFLTCEQKKQDIILSTEIIPKKLFFNKKEEEQLSFLTDLLKPDNYLSVCARMKEMSLRTGFTILLYGEPGVGKTESCFQLAKQSGGRAIFKIEIENTKSKWFGESEKLIKGLFDRYAKMVEKYDLTPIMLLNECDGVLGKRQVGGHSSISQTENAIQNLLLENLEQFSGILIATTNLTQNLDKAFERRFLYKLELHKPDVKTRELIWRDKISGLIDSDYQTLSSSFEFSGGQIDNISRKYILKEILSGVKMNLSQILDLCSGEFLDNAGERKRIGFLA